MGGMERINVISINFNEEYWFDLFDGVNWAVSQGTAVYLHKPKLQQCISIYVLSI